MPQTARSHYLHGSAPEEQRRLSLLNSLLNDACLRELSLRGGERILDLGSGLGQFTRAMARATGPAGRALGIERDPNQLAEARRLAREAGEENTAEFRAGDAFNLPLAGNEWGSFDVAHTRFLLEHVPDPLAVVRNLVRAVCPGGRIVLMDDDHPNYRIWPEPPGWNELWSAYARSFELLGNDPYVGRRLVALLVEAGARPTRNTLIPHVCCAGHPHFAAHTENLVNVIQGARPSILATGMKGSYFDAALVALGEWSRRPEAALWYGLCWAEGVRPA